MHIFTSLMYFSQSALFFDFSFQFVILHVLISICTQFHHLFLATYVCTYVAKKATKMVVQYCINNTNAYTTLWAGQSGDQIPVGVRFSAPVQIGPGAHPASCTMGTRSFPEVKSDWDVTLTPHPLLVPWS
jgi:hypothetical protein